MKFPSIKAVLTKVGRSVPPRAIHYLSGVLNYLAVGRWFRDRNLHIPARVKNRSALYELIAPAIKQPAIYLEFGVFEGEAMRRWLAVLSHEGSRFHGFDSFEGLPENWTLLCDKKVFDLEGRMPVFNDARVTLHKGWFSNTIPPFIAGFQTPDQLVVHLDADLYSSTILPLRALLPHFRVGTVLVFDEFFDREHEMKAFSEFLSDEDLEVECLGGTSALTQVAFRITRIAPPK
jgi:O-methyltransferase